MKNPRLGRGIFIICQKAASGRMAKMAEKREKACNEFIFWKGMSADGQGGHAKGAADKPISGYDAAYIFIIEKHF